MAKLHPLEAVDCTEEQLRRAAYSDNTRLAYSKAWKRFLQFCNHQKIDPEAASADDIINFFIWLSSLRKRNSNQKLSTGTLRLYRSALNWCFTEKDIESPASSVRVADVLGGLSRIRNDSPRKVKALREYDISAMLRSCSNTLFGLRDSAIISLGFAAALRRSELCDLTIRDVNFISPDRMMITIRQSKTDQQGKGQRIAVLEGKSIRPIT